MTNSWMNEDGEPIMDGAAWRFEAQLDMQDAEERANSAWLDDDGWADEPHTFDMDDHDENGDYWCWGCDGYAKADHAE